MSTLSTQPYRGTRDFTPEDQWLQNYIFTHWRNVCIQFGYEEYNTPTLEPLELYAAKTSEEIVQKQTYSFEDRGGRHITIRPEMTPSVTRLVASKRQEWGYPLRLFSIPNCMRYERPQKGRLREFWQLNADIFGLEGIEADVEMIALADALMKTFGASGDMYDIRVNSRKSLKSLVEQAGIKTTVEQATQIIDAHGKMEATEFTEALSEHVDDAAQLITALDKAEPTESLQLLIEKCEQKGISLKYDPFLARGFDYYTDIVFEVFDKHPDNNRSMFGGGRYDNLVGEFGVEPIATVGFGMGDATLIEFLKSHELMPAYEPECPTVALPLTDNMEAFEKVISELRRKNVAIAVDYSGRKTDKMIKTAIKQQRLYALFIGDDELDNQTVSVKVLSDGTQKQLSLEDAAQQLAKPTF